MKWKIEEKTYNVWTVMQAHIARHVVNETARIPNTIEQTEQRKHDKTFHFMKKTSLGKSQPISE